MIISTPREKLHETYREASALVIEYQQNHAEYGKYQRDPRGPQPGQSDAAVMIQHRVCIRDAPLSTQTSAEIAWRVSDIDGR